MGASIPELLDTLDRQQMKSRILTVSKNTESLSAWFLEDNFKK
jgi:hypothetical protein